MTLNDSAQLLQIIEGFRDAGSLRLGFGGDEILFRVLYAAVERGQVEVFDRSAVRFTRNESAVQFFMEAGSASSNFARASRARSTHNILVRSS